MRYVTFSDKEQPTYDIAILAPVIQQKEMLKYYVEPYLKGQEDRVIAFTLHRPKKINKATQIEYLEELLPAVIDLKVKYLIVCDGEYFKTLTKAKTVDAGSGYVLDCVVGGFKVIYCPSYRQIFCDPDKVKIKIDQAFKALNAHMWGKYEDPGKDIVKFAAYPKTVPEIKAWLDRLIDMDVDLTGDIEGFSLKHFSCGLASISFSWNKGEGIAFPIDIRELYGPGLKGQVMERHFNEEVRALLKDFFIRFWRNGRKMIWHNISFDVYVLIYQLFMDDILDQEGLLDGLIIMLENWDCTKLITYLATNSCAGNKLGLKYQSQEFTGNYAVEDIKDVLKIPEDKLLKYNLIDTLATWFVREKHYDTMVKDEQQEIYEGLFKDAIVDIIQMQLTGIPVNRTEAVKVNGELQQWSDIARAKMMDTIVVQDFTEYLRLKWHTKAHEKWKTKTCTMDEVPVNKETTFNPNSAPMLQMLLYDKQYMGFPVIDLTDSKLPATGGETLEKLLNHTEEPDEIAFLDALIEFKAIATILSTFMPPLLAAPLAPDGWHYLFGYLNLGGTLSGRLSSSDPNLQNLPAGGKNKFKQRLAKMFKRCIQAPAGWLFVGLDFSSLEDRISAVTTRDPMKLKVYTDGFDGHCLRALAYFGDEMPDIDPGDVDSVNSIAKRYKTLRQKSKAPTFALTYQGTYITLMNNCGFTEVLAKAIEASYHHMYVISDQWVADRLQEATRKGYITVAFGLRVRTPLLKQVILGTKKTPYEAAAEGRTAGNAMGQSWGLLNTRAASAFMKRVRAGEYRLVIRPCVHIHDAQYYLIRDDIKVVQYVNTHLVKEVFWQDHPDIANDDVKLGGELSIFYPNWSVELEIPNHANNNEIIDMANEHFEKHAA